MVTARVNFSTFRSSRPSEVAEDDPYPLIRSALAPEYADLSAEDVEALLMQNGIRAAAMEGFFDDVGHALSSAAKAVAPIAKKALPGVVSGAAAGCTLGPWGCLGGALVGGVTSALSGGNGGAKGGSSGAGSIIAAAAPVIASAAGGGGVTGTLASALPAIAGLAGGGGGQPAPPQTRPAPPAGGGSRPAPPAGAKNPAGVLLGLLQRPELTQSLMSMALGSAGRQDVAVGDTSVPASAFANLLSVLGSKAFGQAEAWAEPSEDLPDYLYTNGTLVVDPAAPTQRAARLLEMLGEVAVDVPAPVTESFTEADEYYDSLDLAELDSLEMEGEDLEFDE